MEVLVQLETPEQLPPVGVDDCDEVVADVADVPDPPLPLQVLTAMYKGRGK